MRCRIDWSKNAAQARELSVQRDEWFDDEEIKGKDCSFRALTAALQKTVHEAESDALVYYLFPEYFY